MESRRNWLYHDVVNLQLTVDWKVGLINSLASATLATSANWGFKVYVWTADTGSADR